MSCRLGEVGESYVTLLMRVWTEQGNIVLHLICITVSLGSIQKSRLETVCLRMGSRQFWDLFGISSFGRSWWQGFVWTMVLIQSSSLGHCCLLCTVKVSCIGATRYTPDLNCDIIVVISTKIQVWLTSPTCEVII